MRAETRSTLSHSIAQGRRGLGEVVEGTSDVDTIAAREGCSCRHLNATLSLAYLAPDIVEAAIAGSLPHGIGLRTLSNPPMSWSRQRETIGIGRT